MSKIQTTARLTIHDGKLADFRDVANRCIETVLAKDTGTLQYDWFLDESGSHCVVCEAYRDSEAVFEHMENLGPLVTELLQLCEMELEVYGRPSEALAETLGNFGASLYPPLNP